MNNFWHFPVSLWTRFSQLSSLFCLTLICQGPHYPPLTSLLHPWSSLSPLSLVCCGHGLLVPNSFLPSSPHHLLASSAGASLSGYSSGEGRLHGLAMLSTVKTSVLMEAKSSWGLAHASSKSHPVFLDAIESIHSHRYTQQNKAQTISVKFWFSIKLRSRKVK